MTNSTICVDEIISTIKDNSPQKKLLKASTFLILCVELGFLIWLMHYTQKILLTKRRPSWFTLTMTSLLYFYVSLTVLDSSLMLRAANPKEIQIYPEQKNFAQMMAIDQCALGIQILGTTNVFVLWSAAVLLGVKYKMTAQKIHSAISELSVASRVYYREVILLYGGLYIFSFFLYIYMMLAIPKVMRGEWSVITFNIAAGLTFCLILVLFAAYLKSFLQMKQALRKTTGNQISARTQISYLVVMLILSALQIGLCWLNVFQFSITYVILIVMSALARVLLQFVLLVQLIQFSQSLKITTHYGLHGNVIVTGTNEQTNTEIFCFNFNHASKEPTQASDHTSSVQLPQEQLDDFNDQDSIDSQSLTSLSLSQLQQSPDVLLVTYTFLARSPTSYDKSKSLILQPQTDVLDENRDFQFTEKQNDPLLSPIQQ